MKHVSANYLITIVQGGKKNHAFSGEIFLYPKKDFELTCQDQSIQNEKLKLDLYTPHRFFESVEYIVLLKQGLFD